MKNSNLRLIILIVLTIASGIFFILTVIPSSPFVNKNICMENDKAAKIMASSDVKTKTAFIEKRNNDCKSLLKYAQQPKSIYDRIDTCNMVDSVIEASNSYMGLHKGNNALINGELDYLTKNVAKYSYCPQYQDVVKALKEAKARVK